MCPSRIMGTKFKSNWLTWLTKAYLTQMTYRSIHHTCCLNSSSTHQNLMSLLKINLSKEKINGIFYFFEPYWLENNRYACWMAPAVLLASRGWQIEGFGGLTERETGGLGEKFFIEWSTNVRWSEVTAKMGNLIPPNLTSANHHPPK